MKRLTIGILAHVDAGKTTLSEGLLYQSGTIRKLGRVDNRDAYLDTDELERERGITIFSKQAIFSVGDCEITLLDTPGHVDFSAEMERILQVIDYAILVVSAADGIQGHTDTLWRLLDRYRIPVFLFLNKMDQPGTDRETVLQELRQKLSDNCIVFDALDAGFYEEAAVCDETALEAYLEKGSLETSQIQQMIFDRKLFPCYFGSALKMHGVAEFLDGLAIYTKAPDYPAEFAAKVFKIARDEQNNRLTYMKITGGSLAVRQVLEKEAVSDTEEKWSEKVNQIRLYSGERYETKSEVGAGTVCAVTGLTHTFAGQGLGAETSAYLPILEPVMTYSIRLPDGCSANRFLPKLRMLEEEEPELHIIWNEKLGELQAQLMGEVQLEILQKVIWKRFHTDVRFDKGSIAYKETLRNTVEGVGHFEPLRHYAEVHLLLEPAEVGSGVQIVASCSEDVLDRNWQRLICTHLEEKEHVGILTGAPLTDVKITLLSGKAHLKHTEGGDFRQATYRAVRQGLMKAEMTLLEPYYDFVLEIPSEQLGHAMADIERLYGTFQPPEQTAEGSVLRGSAPVLTMQNYQREVASYTKGSGRLSCSLKGYFPCHNEQEVIEQSGYHPDMDLENPSGSVFCSHGAGFTVPWYEVENYMHLPLYTAEKKDAEQEELWSTRIPKKEEYFMGEEEVQQILRKTSGANQRTDARRYQKTSSKRTVTAKTHIPPKKAKEEYLLVDGYNILFAWEELRDLAKTNVDAARGRLLDILSNYQGYKKCILIVVFDAYRVKGNIGQMTDYHNIHVVYTKEAETADQYIEKLAHQMGREYHVTVATSDGLEQLIIRGQGCSLLSAREFLQEVKAVEEEIRNFL